MAGLRYVGIQSNSNKLSPATLSYVNGRVVPKIDSKEVREYVDSRLTDKERRSSFYNKTRELVDKRGFDLAKGRIAKFNKNINWKKQGSIVPLNINNQVDFTGINMIDGNFPRVHIMNGSAITQKVYNKGNYYKVYEWEIPATHRPNLLIFEGTMQLSKGASSYASVHILLSEKQGNSDNGSNVVASCWSPNDGPRQGFFPIQPVNPQVYTGKVYASIWVNADSVDIGLGWHNVICTEYPAF